MLAVRVPPSAWRTSQSTTTCRSPSIVRSQAARSERPMSRWISTVRPLCLPLAASRAMRSADDPGSIEYSAVTHPLPVPRIQRGTLSSTLAVQSTLVRPNETRQDPSAISVWSRSKVTGRNSVSARPSLRVINEPQLPARQRAPASERPPPAGVARGRSDRHLVPPSLSTSGCRDGGAGALVAGQDPAASSSGPSRRRPRSRNSCTSPLDRKRCRPGAP